MKTIFQDSFGKKFVDIILKPIVSPIIDLFPKETDIEIHFPEANEVHFHWDRADFMRTLSADVKISKNDSAT